MPKTFDPSRPVQTRDGRPARIICTDRIGGYPIVALVCNGAYEAALYYTEDGLIHHKTIHGANLINVPEVTYKYQNIYLGAKTTSWHPKRPAVVPGWICLGHLKATFEDGVYKACEFIPE